MAVARRGFRRALHHSSRTHQDPFLLLTEDDEQYEGTPLTHVYFALDHHAAQIKIGITSNVTRRLSQLSSQRGRQLDLLGTMRGGYDLERAMHGRFRDYRAEGQEWYTTEIIADVHALLAPESTTAHLARSMGECATRAA